MTDIKEKDKIKVLEDKITEIMINWNNSNFTVCPECHVDDFVHVENCKFADDNIITRLTKFILSREQELQKEIPKQIFDDIEKIGGNWIDDKECEILINKDDFKELKKKWCKE